MRERKKGNISVGWRKEGPYSETRFWRWVQRRNSWSDYICKWLLRLRVFFSFLSTLYLSLYMYLTPSLFVHNSLCIRPLHILEAASLLIQNPMFDLLIQIFNVAFRNRLTDNMYRLIFYHRQPKVTILPLYLKLIGCCLGLEDGDLYTSQTWEAKTTP